MEEGDAYTALAQLNKGIENFEKANEYNEKYIEIQEKIQILNLKQMNTNSSFMDSSPTVDFSESRSKTSWFNMNSSLFILGIGYFILIPILFRTYKKRLKANSV